MVAQDLGQLARLDGSGGVPEADRSLLAVSGGAERGNVVAGDRLEFVPISPSPLRQPLRVDRANRPCPLTCRMIRVSALAPSIATLISTG